MRTRRTTHRRSGKTIVEMGVVLLVLLPLTLGSFDISLLLYRQAVASAAAERIARQAAVRGELSDEPWGPGTIVESGSEIDTARGRALAGLDRDRTTVRLTWTGGNGAGGEVTVTVTTIHQPLAMWVFDSVSERRGVSTLSIVR